LVDLRVDVIVKIEIDLACYKDVGENSTGSGQASFLGNQVTDLRVIQGC